MVVAIIAVLVAVAIPVFSTQLEKSRRAVDLSNSRDVVAALTVGYLSGDIVFPTNNRVDDPCVVILSTEKKLDYFASGDIKFQGNDWEYDNGKGNYFRVKGVLGGLRHHRWRQFQFCHARAERRERRLAELGSDPQRRRLGESCLLRRAESIN